MWAAARGGRSDVQLWRPSRAMRPLWRQSLTPGEANSHAGLSVEFPNAGCSRHHKTIYDFKEFYNAFLKRVPGRLPREARGARPALPGAAKRPAGRSRPAFATSATRSRRGSQLRGSSRSRNGLEQLTKRGERAVDRQDAIDPQVAFPDVLQQVGRVRCD